MLTNMLRGNVSLESLLNNATNPDNSGPDIAAVEGFAERVNQERDGARIAVRLLASKIQSMHEWEALQALHVLEYCMKTCEESGFVAEVAKFRFLNELIKLVSPKYLGNRTPPSVKSRVLEMVCTWTCQFPAETKIQEAYDMLRKQGVITSDHVPTSCAIVPPRHPDKTSVFEDDDKSRLLRRLLQSKHPDDLQAANRLIKSMVREDEKRSERQSKVTSTLEQVQNNCQLLTEMLMHYSKTGTSTADVELMAELRQSCEQLRPGLSKMAEECGEQDTVLADILQTGDELAKVLENYQRVIVRGEKMLVNSGEGPTSLLDLTSPSEESPSQSASEKLNNSTVTQKKISEADELREIFSSPSTAPVTNTFSLLQTKQSLPLPLLPIAPDPSFSQNLLSGALFQSSSFPASSELNMDKLFAAKNVNKTATVDPLKSLDLDFLVQSQISEGLGRKDESKRDVASKRHSSGDDALLDMGEGLGAGQTETSVLQEEISSQPDDSLLDVGKAESLPDVAPLAIEPEPPEPEKPAAQEPQAVDCKALLADLHVTLESIRPSSKPPVSVIDQADGISVTLHIAQNSPRPGVYVVVISIQSKVTEPVSNVLVQAAISDKSCKLRLQPSSTSELAAFSPFLPPPAATQLMLIANPCDVPVNVKFMVSYTVDGDIVTEMGEVEKLSLK